MRKFTIALLLSSALGGFASAADIAVKAPPSPPPVMLYNWTGFYIGGHFGGGWARKQWADPDPFCVDGFGNCNSDVGSHNAIGVLGGGQVGVNWQIRQWVLGIEGQYSFSDLKGDHQNVVFAPIEIGGGLGTFSGVERYSTKVTSLGTIAGRLGIASGPGDRTLFYVKGGAAFARDKFSLTANQVGVCEVGCEDGTVHTFAGTVNGSHTRWGWMAGTGLEYGLWDNVSAKVEYNYLDLGNKDVSLTGNGCIDGRCRADSTIRGVDQTIHLIKFGLNFRFGGGPVAARY